MSGVSYRKVAADEADLRLDRWFKRHYPGLGHGRLEKMLRKGQIRVDGKRAKGSTRLENGQEIRVPPMDGEIGNKFDKPKATYRLSNEEAKGLQERVLHIDDQVIVIDKPAGLAVQGGSKTIKHLDAMLDALRFGNDETPRLVHRLDKDTSGVLVLARTAKVAAEMTKAFKSKAVRKLYWAAVTPSPKLSKGKINAPLIKAPGARGEKVVVDEEFGKRAVTYFQVVEQAGRKAAWLMMEPVTGRTHQLRVHCQVLETSIVGDGKYGGTDAFALGKEIASQLHLHARGIRFPHPQIKNKIVEVFAPLPEHMKRTWSFLGFDETEQEASDFSVFED